MSSQTGAEAAPERRAIMRSHVSCDTYIEYNIYIIFNICIQYMYQIYIIAEAQIDSDQWPRFACLRLLLGNNGQPQIYSYRW